jgi:hypothetical protein
MCTIVIQFDSKPTIIKIENIRKRGKRKLEVSLVVELMSATSYFKSFDDWGLWPLLAEPDSSVGVGLIGIVTS